MSLFSEGGGDSEPVRMVPCHSIGEDQEWMHTKEGRIIHKASNRCLEAKVEGQDMGLVAAQCKAKPAQLWYFDNYVS